MEIRAASGTHDFPFFVLEHDGEIVGSGGYRVTGDVGELLEGTIRPDLRRKGLGRFLLLYRLRQMEGVALVTVTTAAEHAGFYESQGFRVAEAGEPTRLVKKMNVCA